LVVTNEYVEAANEAAEDAKGALTNAAEEAYALAEETYNHFFFVW